jgi:F0F1-type ATP synthase assembly protein I
MPTSPRPSTIKSVNDALREYLPYANIGYEFVGAVGGGFFIGYLVDRWAGTGFVFMIVFSVLGMFAGITVVIRAVTDLSQKKKQ